MRKISMLGTGLIGTFYTMTLLGMRNKDQIMIVSASGEESAKSFSDKWNIPRWTTSNEEAINDPETDLVVIGLPNHLHKEAVLMAVAAKKPVRCTIALGLVAE